MTLSIFDETAVDKKKRLYKAHGKGRNRDEFTYLSEAGPCDVVVDKFLNAKKKISKENAYYLITICDRGLANIIE